MRPYNHWLFHEHFELVITLSKLYKQMPEEALLEVFNINFPKPHPPPELDSSLNRPPWTKYDLDSLVDDFRLLFQKSKTAN
jgi:hypothetical protein